MPASTRWSRRHRWGSWSADAQGKGGPLGRRGGDFAHHEEGFGLILGKLQVQPELLAALEACYTRLVNIQSGMDAARANPSAIGFLNGEAIEAARVAIARAKGKATP